MMGLTFKGAKELEAALVGMEPKLAKKVFRQAMRKAAAPVLARAKQLVPTLTGRLKKSLRVRAMKKRRHQYGIFVGTSEAWFTGDQFYAGMVEFGTATTKAQPFMRPAFDQVRAKSQQIIEKEIKAGIDRENSKK